MPEKQAKREYQREKYRMNTRKLNQYQRDCYDSKKIRKWNIIVLYSIKISKKKLKFGNIEVNEKEFYTSKQPIALNLLNVSQILISHKFEHSDKDFRQRW